MSTEKKVPPYCLPIIIGESCLHTHTPFISPHPRPVSQHAVDHALVTRRESISSTLPLKRHLQQGMYTVKRKGGVREQKESDTGFDFNRQK